MDPDQDRHSVGSDLGPNCLQMTKVAASKEKDIHKIIILGPLAKSVASPNADPGIENSIPVRSHTFVEIDHEMKKVNKQCLLDTPRTVRVSEKTWQVIVRTRRP